MTPVPPAPDPAAPGSATPLRADAQRNRDQLIAAAARTFVTGGPEVPMEEIARAAGVGVGTLYRRFADRESLMVAVAQTSLATLLTRVRTAEDEERLAWDALVRSMTHLGELKLSLPATDPLPPHLRVAVRADPEVRRLRQELDEATERLVGAAQAEGTLRTDVGAGDVVRLFTLVHRAAPVPGNPVAEQADERALAVLLDGLRTGPRRDLPGRPVAAAELGRG
ncbi:DNA-binding transcriptional regulator, AcrR family [Friedmanniella luteola]|uniref:DNA-binding transcriptional regulator, AcrR family n=1 Tax=Friedmanniella luteola TaxID=546871 RepID=A0A1H1M3B4_9ACTN|nr:TetR/AcrR family transcriptional regulator [Friedmanniella luteola]SDR81226.1 DNA-binding transcriptional regulator, AcrR family [Friedmanniella luteola]